MVREIHVYAEGGGDGKNAKQALKKDLMIFLARIHDELRKKRNGRLRVTACGSRDNASNGFRIAQERAEKDVFNILLVDAEEPVMSGGAREHLVQRDRWDLSSADDGQCHLMVEEMESWFIADVEALASFYGKDFKGSAIPGRSNVEEIPKDDVNTALKKATEKTQKGAYHKIRHASKLLGRLEADVVRGRAPHCERLFKTLVEKIEV